MLALAAAGGLVLLGAARSKLQDRPGREGLGLLIFWAGLLIMPALSVALLYIRGLVVAWAGRALGGVAKPAAIRAAIAWSSLPWLLASAPLLVLALAREAGRLWAANLATALTVPPLLAEIYSLAIGAASVFGLSRYVLYVAEAQGFSVARAIANEVLALVLGVALLAALVGLAYLLYR